MSGEQQRASRSFVTAARLDANEAVLENINGSDGVGSADFVHQFDERYRVESLSTDRNRHALFESDFDLFFFIRNLLRRLRDLPGTRKRRITGVLEFSAFVADVPEIAIAAVNLLATRSHRNAALLTIVETAFAGLQIPLAPRSYDFQLGTHRLLGHLETDLIIALTGASVAHGRGSLTRRHFNLMFRDHGPRERRAEQILILIHRARLQRRPDVTRQ